MKYGKKNSSFSNKEVNLRKNLKLLQDAKSNNLLKLKIKPFLFTKLITVKNNMQDQ